MLHCHSLAEDEKEATGIGTQALVRANNYRRELETEVEMTLQQINNTKGDLERNEYTNEQLKEKEESFYFNKEEHELEREGRMDPTRADQLSNMALGEGFFAMGDFPKALMYV